MLDLLWALGSKIRAGQSPASHFKEVLASVVSVLPRLDLSSGRKPTDSFLGEIPLGHLQGKVLDQHSLTPRLKFYSVGAGIILQLQSPKARP